MWGMGENTEEQRQSTNERLRNKGFLVIVSGPSGVGKNTVLKRVLAKDSDIVYSVSATTRPARPTEKNGIDYFFLTEAEFVDRINNGEFLEWACFCGCRYGTLTAFVTEHLRNNKVVVMDIDIQGARQVRQRMAETVSVFLVPPSFTELERRLRGRGAGGRRDIERRLRTASEEFEALCEYDYVIVNDDPDRAANQLQAIVTAERCRVGRKCLLWGSDNDDEPAFTGSAFGENR